MDCARYYRRYLLYGYVEKMSDCNHCIHVVDKIFASDTTPYVPADGYTCFLYPKIVVSRRTRECPDYKPRWL